MALGLAIEAELGDRQGARRNPSLWEKFPEVKAIGGNFSSADSVCPGRTEEIAAHYAQLGSYKSYQKAKKIMQFGVPELIQVMDSPFPLPIDRAAQIARHSPEEQRYFLSLDRKPMIQALKAASNQAIKKANHQLKENKTNRAIRKSNLAGNLPEKWPQDKTGYALTMTWALLSFVSVLKSENKEECLLWAKSER